MYMLYSDTDAKVQNECITIVKNGTSLEVDAFLSNLHNNGSWYYPQIAVSVCAAEESKWNGWNTISGPVWLY